MGAAELGAWLATPRGRLVCTLTLALAALVVRIPFLDATTGDTTNFVLPWYERIVQAGPAALGELIPNARGETAFNYPPPYYYLLYLASWFDGLAPDLWLIKAISIAFDFLAAYFAFRIVRRQRSELWGLAAAALVLFAPTVVANSAWWGQCDMIWVSLCLGSLMFVLERRPVAAMAILGVALSFKTQAIFLTPFAFLLLVSGHLKLRHMFVVPVVYAAMMLPGIMLGRDAVEVLLMPLRHSFSFEDLSLNAPNPYFFIPNELYAPGVILGLTVAATVALALSLLPRFSGAQLSEEIKVLSATMFMAVMPFILPKMLDRYFLGADVFAFVLVTLWPRIWPVALLLQLASFSAYSPIITRNVLGVEHTNAAMVPAGVMLNTLTVIFLVAVFVLSVRGIQRYRSAVTREFYLAAAALCIALAVWYVAGFGYPFFSSAFCWNESFVLGALCYRDFQVDLAIGGAKHWLAFALLLAAVYALTRWAGAAFLRRFSAGIALG